MKVYHYRRDLDNKNAVCSLGCKHWVTYHEVKNLIPAKDEYYQKWTIGAAPDLDGWGTVRVAYDYQGRRYESEPNWSGYLGWTRGDTNKVWFDRPGPLMDAAFTISGQRIG